MSYKKIVVAVLLQDGDVLLTIIPDTLKTLQELVGGHIEVVPSFCGRPGLIDIVNADGIHTAFQHINRTLPKYVGNVVIAREDGEEIVGLTYKDLLMLLPKTGLGGLIDDEQIPGASTAPGP